MSQPPPHGSGKPPAPPPPDIPSAADTRPTIKVPAVPAVPVGARPPSGPAPSLPAVPAARPPVARPPAPPPAAPPVAGPRPAPGIPPVMSPVRSTSPGLPAVPPLTPVPPPGAAAPPRSRIPPQSSASLPAVPPLMPAAARPPSGAGPVRPPPPPPGAVPPPPPPPLMPSIAPLVPAVAPAAVAPPPPPPPAPAAAANPLDELATRSARLDQMDYFEILRLERTAAPADIKKAFYRESRAYHPDRFFQLEDKALKDRVNEFYKRVTESYYVLRDDAKRRQYAADIAGPERAQKLRFSESSETETRAATKRQVEEQIGVNPKGRQFYQTGAADADAGRWASAERNLKMALTYEPANARYKEKLAEVQKVLLEESRKQGDAFKIR